MKKNSLLFMVSFVFLTSVMLSSCCTSKFVSCPCATPVHSEQSKTVSVSGSGIVNMKADMVSFNIGISERAETTGEAQQKANAKVAQTLALIRDFDIPDDDISTASLSFNTEYRWDNGQQIRIGEVVSQTVIVSMRDISKFGTLVDKLGSSVSGISFDSVSFSSSDMSKAKIQAREAAYEDALAKAHTYAEKSGLKVSGPLSISEGGNSSYQARLSNDGMMYAKAASMGTAYYETDAPTGLLSVAVNVNVVFELVN